MMQSADALSLATGIAWSLFTLLVFWAARRCHRRWPLPLLAPLIVTPMVVGMVVVASRTSYAEYFAGTRWLVWMLGPATVAFAVPVWEQRALIRAHWPALALAMVTGSITALVSTWAMATLLGLDGELLLSLLPRSISTPFAMEVARDLGAVPGLSAVFVIVTGLLGALLGDLMLTRIGARTDLARGTAFGVAAHAIGTARALQVNERQGAIAGLAMVLTGLLNVLATPLLVAILA
jgi:predicted murein hydrolase (TIGR00659 family)